MRTRYPRFMATVRNAYDSQCTISSKSFNNLRICLDECFDEAPESKINWALDRAASYFRNQSKKNNDG